MLKWTPEYAFWKFYVKSSISSTISLFPLFCPSKTLPLWSFLILTLAFSEFDSVKIKVSSPDTKPVSNRMQFKRKRKRSDSVL